ncbi:hypothetical protein RJT34_31987 [Clitoria ternatea]|uniref:Protein kinase domain-containing protein n=1 Tax=Clitoria ternatea TaxID=43366 RepID=A0AAN9F324_CLITE
MLGVTYDIILLNKLYQVKGESSISYICSRYYQALELIFGATEYTTSIDIWSAGCVLAELLLGQVTINALMSSHEGSSPMNEEVQSADIMVMDDSNVSKATKEGTPSTHNEVGSEGLTPNENEDRDRGKKRKLTSDVWNHN